MNTEKMRLDKLLAQKDYFSSRSKAKRAIMAGEVKVDDRVIDKAGTRVSVEAEIEVAEKQRFVSRGGKKLQAALEEFKIDPEGKTALDIGSSTGGFTDCLLQNGAEEVYAVDTGTNQLAWKLRSDSRVEVYEQTNFRYLQPDKLAQKFDLLVIDVSFISLTLLLPNAVDFMKSGAEMVALIKPQFEAGPENVKDGGVVRDPEVHNEVINKVIQCGKENDLKPLQLTFSPIRGSKSKNVEYLLYARYEPGLETDDKTAQSLTKKDINQVVDEAYRDFKRGG